MIVNTWWQRALLLSLPAASGTGPSRSPIAPQWNLTELFGPSLSAHASIYLGSDTNNTDHVTQRWTTHAAPSYIGTVQPATVDDVKNVVRIAARHDIPFLTTGGGHGVSVKMAQLHNGLQIDMRNFNSVRFDADSRRLTVGGSARFSDLIEPLDKAGAQFPLGTAYCVGVVGATLGAGVSANQGRSGLLIDLVESFQLVTPSGDAITVSRSENNELFWALRGAGANFGIITSATFRVPKTENGGRVTNANFLFAGSQRAEFLAYLESMNDDLPAEMAFNIATVYDAQTNQLSLLVNVNFAGPKRDFERHFARLQNLKPVRSELLEVPWPKVFSTSYFGIEDTKACGRNQLVNMRSVGAAATNAKALTQFLDELEDFNAAMPDVVTAMVVHRFATDAVLRVPDSDSAYPYRSIKLHLQLESEYHDRKYDRQVDEFLNRARTKLTAASGYDSPVVYINFAHGDEGPKAWYGSRKLGRLAALKNKWDPRGLFGFYNTVPADWPGLLDEDEL